MIKRLLSIVALMGVAIAITTPAALSASKSYKVGYAIYVSFMPFQYMDNHGILKKWADKYDIEIEMIQINDYVGGINQFVVGDLQAFTGNPMDIMTTPSAGGVDTSFALALGYSDGTDGLISKTANSVKDLKGETVYLYELTISHYLLSRALDVNGMSLRDIKTVNISDTDMAAAWISSNQIQHAVSWNPMMVQMEESVPNTTRLFDSSDIEGEIADGMYFRSETLENDPDLVKAMTGAWYETMQILSAGGEAADAMIAEMADASGSSVEEFQTQLDSVTLFYEPKDAVEFMDSQELIETLDFIRTFSFDHGLFGQGAASKDFIGIETADGTILGDVNNVKMRIDSRFTKMARDGKL